MKKYNKSILFLLCLSLPLSASTCLLKTIYGEYEITEQVLIGLLQDPYFQRLEHIRQYGVDYYAIKPTEYTRAEHSKGVLVLLKRYGASLQEQVAGLLHDVSHTVFSHVGDSVFDHQNSESSYQDDIHHWFLKQTTIPGILHIYCYSIVDIHHKNPAFTCLESHLPDLCADRIEYNLMGGYLEGLITRHEILELLNHLHFENHTWYFDEAVYAKKLAEISLYLTENVWSSPQGKWVDYWAAQALKKAVQSNSITFNEIHFGFDDEIWQKLTTCSDEYVQQCLDKLKNYKSYSLSDMPFMPGKFRGVNPWVQTSHGLQRLTAIDESFKNIYEHSKKRYKKV
ncbi:MAG: HD domain-containing protein [Candidatus Babeliaceae bacterium]